MSVYWIDPELGTSSVDEMRAFQSLNASIFYVTHLVDGWNDPEEIYRLAKKMLTCKRPIIIVCHAGVSRSNGMAALLVAYRNRISWDEGYEIVKTMVPRANTCMDFRDCCIRALTLLRGNLQKKCSCGTPIESWESLCFECWYRKEDKDFEERTKTSEN